MGKIFHDLSNSLKKRLDPHTKNLIQIGYLNSELQRTNVGLHQMSNFIEEKFPKEWAAYVKALKAEKVADAKENSECGD